MIGIDEVGRGCWAGPLLVVAARSREPLSDGVADSKTLTKKKRQALMSEIENHCDLGEGWVSNDEIDKVGLTAAMRIGVKRALKAINAQSNEQIIMDGTINYCPDAFNNVTCQVKADASVPIVGAASIFAKVRRDQFMTNMSLEFPGYGFEKHVGYGTQAHLLALKSFGVTRLHRQSYKPVQAFI